MCPVHTTHTHAHVGTESTYCAAAAARFLKRKWDEAYKNENDRIISHSVCLFPVSQSLSLSLSVCTLYTRSHTHTHTHTTQTSIKFIPFRESRLFKASTKWFTQPNEMLKQMNLRKTALWNMKLHHDDDAMHRLNAFRAFLCDKAIEGYFGWRSRFRLSVWRDADRYSFWETI